MGKIHLIHTKVLKILLEKGINIEDIYVDGFYHAIHDGCFLISLSQYAPAIEGIRYSEIVVDTLEGTLEIIGLNSLDRSRSTIHIETLESSEINEELNIA